MTTHVVHREGCMCDECIKARTRARVAAADAERAQRPYIERRSAEIGEVSVADALKQRNK